MAYTTSGGPTGANRMTNLIPATLAASNTLTATAASTGVELGDRNSLRLDLVITAASGSTPTLDITVQTSPDNATWSTVAAFAQQTTTTTGVHKVFGPIDRFVRINSVITGTTPSFTFSVSGDAA